MSKETTTFASDTKDHKMTVIKNDDLYRHLHFSKRYEDGSFNSIFWFDIHTWPGSLCIHGDCGTFVFERVKDMFTFFRGKGTNLQYWAEKLTAISRHGYQSYSYDTYKKRILEWADNEVEEMDAAERASFMKAVEDQLLDDNYGETARTYESAYQCMDSFRWERRDGTEIKIYDAWDWGGFNEYDYHYRWCCEAIVWAIEQYDKAEIKIEAPLMGFHEK